MTIGIAALSQPLKWKFGISSRMMTSFWCCFATASKCKVTLTLNHCIYVINSWAHFTARRCWQPWPSTLILPFKIIMKCWRGLQRHFSCLSPSLSLTLCWQYLKLGGIRVSKQCCPACARLFHCLLGVYDKKDDREDWPKIVTQALASHAVPYPVQLPQWLPDNIVDGMVTSFRPHLMQALDLLAYPVMITKSVWSWKYTERTRQ